MNWQGFTDRELPLPGEPIPGRFGYRRVKAEEYHKFPAINASLLKCDTAAEMFKYLTRPSEDTDAKITGTLVHLATLEPETSWSEAFAVADIPINPKTNEPYGPKTKKASAAWEAAKAACPGKIIVTPETFHNYMEECRELQVALACNPDAMSELTDVDTEVSGFLWHPRWNCWLKWRLDIMPKHCRYLVDVKSTSRSPKQFEKDIWQWKYNIQAVFYGHCHEMLMSRLNLSVAKFSFIILSKPDKERPAMCRMADMPLVGGIYRPTESARTILGLPEGFSRIDLFLDCLRNHIEAGCPSLPPEDDNGMTPERIKATKALRKIWPAYENEAGEKGRWVLSD